LVANIAGDAASFAAITPIALEACEVINVNCRRINAVIQLRLPYTGHINSVVIKNSHKFVCLISKTSHVAQK
jgi:hypothetical protein